MFGLILAYEKAYRNMSNYIENIKLKTVKAVQKQNEKINAITDKEEYATIIKQLNAELTAKTAELEALKSKLGSNIQLSKLKKTFKQLQDFLSLAPVAIYFKNDNLEYTFSNQSFAALVNLPVDEMMGANNISLHISNILSELEEIEKTVLKNGNAIQNKEICFSLDNEQLMINAFVFPMKGDSAAIEGVMVCCFDLTERLQYESELKRAEEKAQLGVKSKHTFLANLSHEIRTPLHGILGSGALLKMILKESQELDLLDNINRSGSALLEMIDSLLLFESLEKGSWAIKSDPFMIRELIGDICDKFRSQAVLKAIDLQCFVAQGLPEVLLGDAEKIKLILSVFFNNAIKFTEKGFVHVFVQAEKNIGDKIRLKFSVKDTGAGIKKELQGDIFTSFTQGDSSSTKGYQGTGMGLAMAEKTISYLGGQIGFESAEYKGSTFWFTLDVEKIDISVGIKTPIYPSELPVLLVEDNKINQKIAFFTLKKLGFPVEIAENGLEAIERYQNEKFSIVLMDIQMPVMNGFDATSKIRAYEKEKKTSQSLIIALSANTVKEDVEKCFVVGMNEYISKPFSPEKLIEVIQKHIEIKFH